MKALVTGASGFVGRHVVRRLEEDEISVITTDTHGSVDHVLDLAHDGVGDELPDVDVVVHLAANADAGKFIDLPATLTTDTLIGTVNLLSWVRRHKPREFILLSTSEVYGDIAVESYATRPWDTITPSTVYGASKAAQEVLALGWCRTYGVPVTILNTMNVFGPGQRAERFVPTIVRSLLAGEDVPIAVTEKAEITRRCWTPVEHVADAIAFLAVNDDHYHHDSDPIRYHIVGPEMDCKQLVQEVANELNVEPTFTYFHFDRPGYELRYALDGSEIYYSGFAPRDTFKNRLRNTVLSLYVTHKEQV